MNITLECGEKQREFLHYILVDKEVQGVGFGGARGGTKTFSSCLAMIIRRLKYPGTRGLMLRRIQSSADRNLGEEIVKIVKMLGLPVGRGGIDFNKQSKTFYFPNGSYIQLGYCRTDRDWEQYQGLEYMDIAFEEAAQFPEDAWTAIIGSNRPNIRGLNATPKVWATFNPGGIGALWVDTRFGIKDSDTRDYGYVFIQSLLKDSKPLLEQDPSYRDRVLAKQPEWRRKQWEDGDWYSYDGAFFEFNPDDVYIDTEIPYWADVFCGVDAGYFPSSFAVIYVGMWTDDIGVKRLHVFSEIKKTRLGYVEQANEATSMESYFNHKIRIRYADPSCWKREGGSICSTAWLENGFVVTPAYTNARAYGWTLIRDLIKQGRLTISPKCMALRSEIDTAIHDQKTDDIADGCEDHCLDAFRYAIVSTVFNVSEKKITDPYERRRRARLRERGKTTQ